MPITDYIKRFLSSPNFANFLTDLSLPPEQQEAAREFRTRQTAQQAAGAQAQENWEKQFAAQESARQAQEKEAAARTFAEYLKIPGISPVQQEPPAQTGGPSFGAGGGPTAGGQAIPETQSTDDIMEMLQPGWRAFTGQQQQTGLGVNAPGAIPSGVTTTGNRLLPTGASSGGGAVVSPTAPRPLPITNLPGGFPSLQFTPEEDRITVPAEIAAKLPGMVAGQKLKVPQYMEALKLAQAQGTPKGKDSEDEVLLQSRLAHAGITDDWRSVAKTNPTAFAAARREVEEIKNPAMAAQRKLQEQDLADKLKLNKAEQDNAVSFWERVKQDPAVWFDKLADKKTKSFAEELARQKGEEAFIPTQELTPQRRDQQVYSLGVKMMNSELRNITAELLTRDPNVFGPLLGRWSEANLVLGTPVSKDPRVNYLVGRFRDLVNPMIAQETKQVGGGRAAIQLMSMLKAGMAQLHDNPEYLKAAFDTTDFIADALRSANRKFMFGITDPKGLVPGDPLKIKGKPYHFKRYTPSGGIETVEKE